ncbi:hypothetical protein HDU76_008036 [Blyttiomyces sp. JEL0837]|nr:hypothetical protein HDU76_008036 [Blyttiomyces sp. JEL0837]
MKLSRSFIWILSHFTRLSGSMEPQVLVARLNSMFSILDEICKRHDVEKILTIGDAYVAAKLCEPDVETCNQINVKQASGIRDRGEMNLSAESVCFVAIEMQNAMIAIFTAYAN